MRRWTIRIAILLLLIAGIWTLRSTVFTADPLVVEVVAVERGRVEETVTNSRAGTVEARKRAKLSPEIGGTVVELPFREGERVARGDLLLRLEDSLQRARLEVAQEFAGRYEVPLTSWKRSESLPAVEVPAYQV